MKTVSLGTAIEKDENINFEIPGSYCHTKTVLNNEIDMGLFVCNAAYH